MSVACMRTSPRPGGRGVLRRRVTLSEQPREDPPAVRRALRRREFLAAAGVAGLGLMAGCGPGGSTPSGSAGGQAGSAPAAGGGATTRPEVVKVRVGVIAGLAETVYQYL